MFPITGMRDRPAVKFRKEARDTMDAYETINDVLVNLFYEILELEEKAIITDEFRDIQ